MLDRNEIGKRGYLNEGFRLFHLKDSRAQQLDPHYHEFDKIILPLGGKVTYTVEGVTYFLKPWDILLVPRSSIHRPVIDPSEPYERFVLWLNRQPKLQPVLLLEIFNIFTAISTINLVPN